MNEDKYSELITAMKILIAEYKSLEVVPKKLTLSFVDSTNYFYSDEDKYSFDEQNRIEDAV